MKIINNCLTKVDPSDIVNGTFVIPPDVHTIVTYAFSSCGDALTHIEIPDTILHIGSNAFANCTKLKSVKLPNNLKSLSESMFENCKSLESIEIPESVNFIGASAFASCSSLKSIKIPSKINEIYFSTFKNCSSLENVELGENLLSLFPNAFQGCKSLKEISIPKNVSIISLSCFEGCSELETVNFSEGLVHLKSDAFKNCTKLKNINIPSTLKEISNGAFMNCHALESVTIPKSVSSLGNEAFMNCTGLKSAVLNNIKISSREFAGCTSLKNVEINMPVIKIENSAFEDCKSLENVSFNASIRHIDNNAFSGCASLKNISLPEGVLSIKKNAFLNCENLESINLPSTIQSIEEDAFTGCDTLEYLHIPNNTKSMKPFNSNSLLFFNKTEDGFNLSANQTAESIPTKSLNLNYSFLSKYWKYKDILLKEQRNPNVADFYNRFISILPEDKAEEFILNHNFTFFKQFHFEEEPLLKSLNFYKALYNLGAFQPPIINDKGKKIDYAQKVVGFLLEKVDLKNLNGHLLNMDIEGFKPEFTDFFIQNYLSQEMINELKKSPNFLARCYNEFEEVQETNTSNRGSQRQLKPTIEKFKTSFISDKYHGVTPENIHIAKTISPYFSEQSTFNHAIEIDEERRKKGVRNNILKHPLKESDVFTSIDEYTKKIKIAKPSLLGSLVDIASNEFTFEWLEKNDPENFILGKLCSCCAHLEGVGYGIMHASIVHPNVQNLVIRNKKGEIVAKSTLFINKLGRYGVCNNVEVKNGISGQEVEEIYQKFVLGIREFAKKYNQEHPLMKLKQINVGTTNNDLIYPIQLNRKQSLMKLNALRYGKYGRGDSRYDGDSFVSQYVIWSDKEEKYINSTKLPQGIEISNE